MKRFLCALLVCLMITPALSEGIELSSLTDDEIISLYDAVNNEMITRGLFREATLPAGAYYAGSFIPEGTYVCTLESGGGAVYTYANYEAFLQGSDYLSRVYMRSGDSITLILTGETCYVFEVTTTVRPGGLVW